ncbi:MAG: FAD:protein FMN transferase [Phycisphaerales bacterium]|nr:FAD:protein FMN transferase [Phycisphaerales bacterium]
MTSGSSSAFENTPALRNQNAPANRLSPRHRRSAGAVLVLLVVLATFLANRLAGRGSSEVQLAGETMGTIYNIKFLASRDSWNATAKSRIETDIADTLEEVNRRMSTWLPDSELSRLNRSQVGEPFALSAETFAVFQAALEVSKCSGGAFDITVGPVVNAYGFGPGPDHYTEPDPEILEHLAEAVGYQKLLIEPAVSTVIRTHDGMYCDLSAIAKGYGVDRVSAVLEQHGIDNYMVEIGGEIRLKGRRENGRLWRIAVEKPVGQGRTLQRIMELTDVSIATSGDYQNYFVRDGRRISHTIDPRTARPVDHTLASVTVLHEQCMWADAWATALMVLGPLEGFEVAEREQLAALFLIRHDDTTIQARSTSAFEAYHR